MTGTLRVTTRDVEETRKVGAAIAELLIPGDVVSLSGDLGAGKTALVQGSAAALGVTDPVTSPTFVLVREYRGSMPIRHVDVYRLERIQEVLDLGFEDLLDPDGVTFIEWGDAIEALLPETLLRIDLRSDEADTRTLDVMPRGPTWAGRWERVEAALSSWRSA